MNQASVPASVYLYHKYYEGSSELSETTTAAVTTGLLVCWLTTFCYLVFVTIVPRFCKDFWSLRTGHQYCQSFFLDNEGNDGTRITIFDYNFAHWQGLEEDIKEWTMANFQRWEDERPEWFTPVVKASMPERFKPATIRRQITGGTQRRIVLEPETESPETVSVESGVVVVS